MVQLRAVGRVPQPPPPLRLQGRRSASALRRPAAAASVVCVNVSVTMFGVRVVDYGARTRRREPGGGGGDRGAAAFCLFPSVLQVASISFCRRWRPVRRCSGILGRAENSVRSQLASETRHIGFSRALRPSQCSNTCRRATMPQRRKLTHPLLLAVPWAAFYVSVFGLLYGAYQIVYLRVELGARGSSSRSTRWRRIPPPSSGTL